MPWNKVMSKWKSGDLHSGSKKGKTVTSQKQAVAIMLSEKRAAKAGKSEYAATEESASDKKRRKKAESMLGPGAQAAAKRRG